MRIKTRQNYGIESKKEKEHIVDKVEKAILKYQASLWDGYICVDDNTYNTCIEYLEHLNPYSDILRNDRKVYTYYNMDDKLKEKLWEIVEDSADDIYFMLNPQGLNVKLYYEDGVLLKAETYGRTMGKQDITNIIKKIIGYKNDMIDKEGKITLVGAVVLPMINIDVAKELCNAQDTYTGVFSVIKAIDSVTEEDEFIDDYTDILMFVCTDVIIEGLPNISVEAKINYIKDFGIDTAPILKLQREGSDILTVDDALFTFETLHNEIDYKTDGVRIIPTNIEDKSIYILKVKKWGRYPISSTVMGVDWLNTKDGYKPVILLDRDIELYNNSIVNKVEMDKLLYLLFLDIEVGNTVRFIYSEEIGYIPLDESNKIIIV